jgi:hypothetical protein
MVIRLLIFILVFFCNACTPEYSRFVPQSDSYFQISFDYPSEWVFSRYKGKNFEDMNYLYPSEGFILAKNMFSISVSVESSAVQVNEDVQFHLSAIRSFPNRMGKGQRTLGEREFEIDGMKAYEINTWSEWHNEINPGWNIITKNMFILDGGRYYWITVNILESDFEKTFSKQVDHLLESIKKIP